MFDNYQEERDRKKAIIALLIKMATVDQDLRKTEKNFILNIAEQIDLVPGEVIDIIESPERYATLQAPASEQERMTILYYLLFLMRIDGEIHEKEEELCFKAGLRLGFNEQLTGDLIGVMKKHLTGPIPPETMLKEIRKYMN